MLAVYAWQRRRSAMKAESPPDVMTHHFDGYERDEAMDQRHEESAKRCGRKRWPEEEAKRWARAQSTKWLGTADHQEYLAECCAACAAWHVRRTP